MVMVMTMQTPESSGPVIQYSVETGEASTERHKLGNEILGRRKNRRDQCFIDHWESAVFLLSTNSWNDIVL